MYEARARACQCLFHLFLTLSIDDTLNWIVEAVRTASEDIESSFVYQLKKQLAKDFLDGPSSTAPRHAVQLVIEWQQGQAQSPHEREKWIRLLGTLAKQLSDVAQVTFCTEGHGDQNSRLLLDKVSSIWCKEIFHIKDEADVISYKKDMNEGRTSVSDMLLFQGNKLALLYYDFIDRINGGVPDHVQ